MTRRRSVCVKWTLVLLLVVFCSFVHPRPQEASSPVVSSPAGDKSESTESPIRETSQKALEEKQSELESSSTAIPNSSRDVKTKIPIRESIKMVANQLLDKPENTSIDTPIVADTRIPPKLKTQMAQKHKIKTRNEEGDALYNGHAGEAVPVTIEDLETENKISDVTNESSTSNEGISTWILLSNPTNVSTASTEPTKTDNIQKKPKPSANKNKTKRPQNNKASAKRPIIGSINKSDLVAGGSAINENIYNKLKDTVLSNVQKNKSTSTQRTTTTTTTTPLTESPPVKKEVTKAPVAATKPKKKNKNKQKTSTTEPPAVINESALLPMEPKEQEIELEVSTPAITTKKPKRSTTRKKNKTKKRKTSTPKPEDETSITEIKTSVNKTKSSKPAKKPIEGPITTQIYNYLSREVMPSVGVGMLGLASIVGIASYFFYPFSTPVRRTFELDKKDDLYKYNAEEYASEGNGQAEEEMLGTVLAGMPAHAKQKLNPYAGQTTAHVSRYPVRKEQDIRYRHVAGYDPKYNRYPQQKTGIAHAAVYSKPIHYGPQYETRHAYTTEGKYNYEKTQSYTPYSAVEPIYAAPQTGSDVSSFSSETSNSVVYGVKPSAESDFKPVYPFEGQFYSESTSSPITYAPTSMYLGSNNEKEEETPDDSNDSDETDENKFVVGNVPKELVDTATPAVVPEHGPRKLKKRSISSSLEEILQAEKNNKGIFISNEIDDAIDIPIRNLAPITEPLAMNDAEKSKEVIPIYGVSVNPKEEDTADVKETSNIIIESVSTQPRQEITTEGETMTELDVTTKAFRVYEVFPSTNPVPDSSPLLKEVTKVETTTQFRNVMTETTTETKSETTSTLPPSPPPVSVTSDPSSSSIHPSTSRPEVITYPPLDQSGGFLSFLKRLFEFKYRLGISILQSTSESLNRYLRNIEGNMQKATKASHA